MATPPFLPTLASATLPTSSTGITPHLQDIMKTKTPKTKTPHALFQRISNALETSPYVPHRKVRFETAANGSIVLRGHVESFFQKQMTQETLRRVDGVDRIENHLEVNWAYWSTP